VYVSPFVQFGIISNCTLLLGCDFDMPAISKMIGAVLPNCLQLINVLAAPCIFFFGLLGKGKLDWL
jgi:hypothetical protein